MALVCGEVNVVIHTKESGSMANLTVTECILGPMVTTTKVSSKNALNMAKACRDFQTVICTKVATSTASLQVMENIFGSMAVFSRASSATV